MDISVKKKEERKQMICDYLSFDQLLSVNMLMNFFKENQRPRT